MVSLKAKFAAVKPEKMGLCANFAVKVVIFAKTLNYIYIYIMPNVGRINKKHEKEREVCTPFGYATMKRGI